MIKTALILGTLALGLGLYIYLQKSTKNAWPTSSNPDEYTIVVKVHPDSHCIESNDTSDCKSNIYLKDSKIGKEQFLLTAEDIINDTRVPIYRNGKLFTIRRVGNDEYPSQAWTDELWVYSESKRGEKLYDSKGLSFSVNDTGSIVAVDENLDVSNKINVIKNSDPNETSFVHVDMKECMDSENAVVASNIDFIAWENETRLWGAFTGALGVIGCFWSADVVSEEIEYFKLPDLFPSMVLNPKKKVASYSDLPVFLDVDGEKEWLLKNSSYSLYLYDLETQKSTKIVTVPAQFEEIRSQKIPNEGRWISATQLQYPTPDGARIYTLE